MHVNISKARAERMVPDSSVVPSDSSNAYKLKHKKFRLKTRKNFFSLRVADHWNLWLPREVMLFWRHSKPTWMCSCVTCSCDLAFAGCLD